MARIETKEDEVNSRLKLPPAFTDKDKITIWFHGRAQDTGGVKVNGELIENIKFNTVYAAKKYLDAVIDGRPTKWLGPNRLLINDWIVASTLASSSESLEEIVEHNYSKAEKQWRLPVPYDSRALNTRNWHFGMHPDINTQTRAAHGKPRLDDDEYYKLKKEEPPKKESLNVTRTPKPKREKKERAAKARSARLDMITLSQICAELKIDPREARAALRDAGTKKPDAGWAWSDRKQIPDIAKIHKKWSSK